MSTGTDSGRDADANTINWHVVADHAKRRALGRARRDERRTNSLGLIITTSLFFVLFAAALVFGGHAALPLLHHTVAASDTQGNGDIVYSMPDGVFCRHMSFDNATGEVTEGAIDRCKDNIVSERALTPSKFEWGTH